MRKVTLTAKNVEHVASMLRRFFGNPKFGFTIHHNFDCGFKNIKPYSSVELDRTVDGIKTGETYGGQKYISVSFIDGVSGLSFDEGSIFVFKGGNEIIVQSKWLPFMDNEYVYHVFRLAKISLSDIYDIAERRAFDKQMADDFYDHMLDDDDDMFDDSDIDIACNIG